MKTQQAPKSKREVEQADRHAKDADLIQASVVDGDDWLPGMSDGDFARPVPLSLQQ